MKYKFKNIYILNQNIDIQKFVNFIKQTNQNGDILIVSTNFFFDKEKEKIKNLLGNKFKIIFKIFTDFLNDYEMSECDTKSTSYFNDSNFNNSIFMKKSNFFKNKIIYGKLANKYDFDKKYFIEGLGIEKEIWEKDYENITLQVTKTINTSEKKYFAKKEIIEIYFNNKKYLFFGNIDRLKIKKNKNIIIKKINDSYILQKRQDIEKNYDYVCSTIHNYDAEIAKYFKVFYVFIDGYHPSNYSRSYIDIFLKNSIFVGRDFIDIKWFQKYGFKIHKPFEFLEEEYMKFVTISKIKTVLLMLNHAGDWSALINRSDTDILINSFINMSKKFPNYNFIIRVHPTMNLAEHEGIYSKKRIINYIKQLNYKNLTISKNDFIDDIKKADIVISEYSNGLLEAIKYGKIGISLNLTRRRNFMLDYCSLGFNCFNSLDEIYHALNNLKTLIKNQNNAIKKFNYEQKQFYNKGI